ncbi:2-oxo-4-hydroxy-4-carboxy-5-ureidoimidazoline decarboxylase [Microbacterium sp.]|uniref:2-oxo-4-hydroxy-4-carboxy-5-ureidoimidazoline decarboxylase n=1 Tax=Microbacterium sp. TaxID=51671 RepID=UPI0037CB6626
MLLSEFNDADASAAASVVRVWADIPAWTAAVVDERPYASIDDLEARAASLAQRWSVDDLDAALAHHPRIGERPTAFGAEGDASRSEQAAMTTAADDVTARIAEGNAAYEERFGRVFLIRAAGRTPDEILANLERRLASDPETEAAEARAQLAEIAMLRLRNALTDDRMGA